MMRRVLLAAAVAAVSLAHAPAAQADYCPATAELTGTINLEVEVPPRCLPWTHGVICQGAGVSPSVQTVHVTACVPNPLAQGEDPDPA